jgi:precorrin-2 dehydrogenase/sirohydrochlorin ferrochelatase
MLATLLRHDIEARVPQGAGRVAALFRTLQDEVRTALPDLAARRAFLRDALTGPAAQAAQAGDMDTAARLLREALASPEAQRGLVQVIDARGPADLLTLRAAQALASADILVVDEGACAEVLALARRDAERLATAEVDVERLAGLAARGLRVARLVTAAGWRAELEALLALGVEAHAAPIAGY